MVAALCLLHGNNQMVTTSRVLICRVLLPRLSSFKGPLLISSRWIGYDLQVNVTGCPPPSFRNASLKCELLQGLDDLGKRCAKYYEAGARFAKWRAVLKISATAPSPLVRCFPVPLLTADSPSSLLLLKPPSIAEHTFEHQLPMHHLRCLWLILCMQSDDAEVDRACKYAYKEHSRACIDCVAPFFSVVI